VYIFVLLLFWALFCALLYGLVYAWMGVSQSHGTNSEVRNRERDRER
jgi:hypothetical protein